jgi:hypothetical protein
MISQSRDGNLIADLCRLLNFRPIRGSSSRGGRDALAVIVADLKNHRIAIHMAQLSGVPTLSLRYASIPPSTVRQIPVV